MRDQSKQRKLSEELERLLDAYAEACADVGHTGHESAKSYAALARSNLINALKSQEAERTSVVGRTEPRDEDERAAAQFFADNPSAALTAWGLYRNRAPRAAPDAQPVDEQRLVRVADELFDHQRIGANLEPLDRAAFQELAGSLIAAYLDAPSAQPEQAEQQGEPHIVKLWASGGSTGISDYLMSDGSIKTLSLAESERYTLGAPSQQMTLETERRKASIWREGFDAGRLHGVAEERYDPEMQPSDERPEQPANPYAIAAAPLARAAGQEARKG